MNWQKDVSELRD